MSDEKNESESVIYPSGYKKYDPKQNSEYWRFLQESYETTNEPYKQNVDLIKMLTEYFSSSTKEHLKKQKRQELKQKIQSLCENMDKTEIKIAQIRKKYALSD